ncbi:MAG: cation transporter [Peptoniphilaceae bacterium]|nr:cation transporter [Peptoniphilaceae bacterium]MDY6019352.1 cation transporter [Anaerococcus sp.]
MKKKYKIKGLGCANCAAQMEEKIKKIKGVKNANVSFMTENLKLEVEDEDKLDEILDMAQKIITSIEPDTELIRG